jgi:hypothetical protein
MRACVCASIARTFPPTLSLLRNASSAPLARSPTLCRLPHALLHHHHYPLLLTLTLYPPHNPTHRRNLHLHPHACNQVCQLHFRWQRPQAVTNACACSKLQHEQAQARQQPAHQREDTRPHRHCDAHARAAAVTVAVVAAARWTEPPCLQLLRFGQSISPDRFPHRLQKCSTCP